MHDAWDRWIRDYIVRMIAYGRQRGLRGDDLRAHVDRERRYAIARRNVHWAKLGDEVLIANRIDTEYGTAWMDARLQEKG
jgi:hypothetical protein